VFGGTGAAQCGLRRPFAVQDKEHCRPDACEDHNDPVEHISQHQRSPRA